MGLVKVSDTMIDLEPLKTLTDSLSLVMEEGIGKEQLKFNFDYFKVLLDNLNEMAALFDKDSKILIMNDCLEKDLTSLGLNPECGKAWNDVIKVSEETGNSPINRCIESNEVIIDEWVSPNTKYKYRYVCIPLIYRGVATVFGLAKRV